VGEVDMKKIDILVNMSGQRLPSQTTTIIEDWKVFDPYGSSEEVYRQTCNDIEMKVMNLILRIRSGKI
jgi:protein-tyrosine-phosphatase